MGGSSDAGRGGRGPADSAPPVVGGPPAGPIRERALAAGASPDGADSPAGPADAGSGRQPGILFLLSPKLRGAARRAREAGGVVRGVVLGTVGLLFWALLFGILFRLLRYFQSAEGIGDVLAVKLLGLILLGFLSVLLLSNIITALSSFFLARDLELFMAAPVDGLRSYGARLTETMIQSSWMVVLVLVPILIAYGWVFDGGWAYLAISVVAVPALLMLPAVVGAAITLALVNIFPARRARDLLALVALFGAAGLIFLVRLLRPEQLVRPEGFRNLVDFIAVLDTPSSVWLPSEWTAEALMAGLSTGSGDLFGLLLITTTAAAFLVLGAWVHQSYYARGFSRAQEGSERKEASIGGQRLERVLGMLRLPMPARALIAKDIRTFFRDTTQWSQLILLAVLVAVYVYNIKVLPLWSGEPIGFFLINVVSFLNLGLAGFVLAAIAVRFLFPAVSLEGGALWLLRSSPLDLRQLIWTKYWVGLAPLLILALGLTLGTNLVLRVGPFMVALSLVTMAVMTSAIASLAIGFGAMYPRFETGNAAQIATGFGGLIFMMTATAYVALVIVLEAWPVYHVLRARMSGVPLGGDDLAGLAVGLGVAVVLSAIAVVVPLRIAARRVGELAA